MPLPVKLEHVQKLMAAGDARARRIYETIGVYFGYNIATYADFYEVRNLLVLGRVMTGEGGDLILSTRHARSCAPSSPKSPSASAIHIPDEKEKRHGQAIAAASLPSIPAQENTSMQFHKSTADFFVPDGTAPDAASPAPRISASPRTRTISRSWRTTASPNASAARTSGSPAWWSPMARAVRAPASTAITPIEEMQQVRLLEQRKAAYVGEYACQIQLAFTSSEVKNPKETAVVEDLAKILLRRQPRVRLPAQSRRQARYARRRHHARHRRAARRARPSQAEEGLWLRSLARPGLDARRRQAGAAGVSARSNIAAALVGVFDSQVSGGKRYDLATAGRRLAHATYYASHGTDQETALNFAMDLTPLVEDPSLSVADYVLSLVDRFRADVSRRVNAVT